jgi:hypothetical protein
LVEGELTAIEDLEDIVRDYYTANIETTTNEKMPFYVQVTRKMCREEIQKNQAFVDEDPENLLAKAEVDSWTTKLALCESLPEKEYPEISKMAIIRLENQAGTSYGLYIEIQNILKKVVNEQRVEYCSNIWDRNYFELDKTVLEDQDIIKKLRVLVPERIIEAKIKK